MAISTDPNNDLKVSLVETYDGFDLASVTNVGYKHNCYYYAAITCVQNSSLNSGSLI